MSTSGAWCDEEGERSVASRRGHGQFSIRYVYVLYIEVGVGLVQLQRGPLRNFEFLKISRRSKKAKKAKKKKEKKTGEGKIKKSRKLYRIINGIFELLVQMPKVC